MLPVIFEISHTAFKTVLALRMIDLIKRLEEGQPQNDEWFGTSPDLRLDSMVGQDMNLRRISAYTGGFQKRLEIRHVLWCSPNLMTKGIECCGVEGEIRG